MFLIIPRIFNEKERQMKTISVLFAALLMPLLALAHVDKEHEAAAQDACVPYACPRVTGNFTVESRELKDALVEYIITHTSSWPAATPYLYLGKPYAAGCIAGFVLNGNMNAASIFSSC